jgi:hypothetical protein
MLSHNCISGQCRTNPWPAVEDWPWCRTTNAGLTQLNTRKKDVARLTFFLHSGIYLLFHHQQYECEKVFFSRIHSLCCVNVRVFSFPHPTVWTWGCIVSVDVRVYPFTLPAGVDVCVSISIIRNVNMRVYPFSPPAVWTWGYIPCHCQQCGCKGGSPFTVNSVDESVYPCLQSTVWKWGVSLSAVPSVDVQGISLSTASSVDVPGVSLSHACCMYMLCVSTHTLINEDMQSVSIFTISSVDM